MTDIRSQGQRKRRASLWCGGIALGGAGIPVLLWAMIMVGNEGPTLMAAILPAAFLLLTWWIWLILAGASLLLARDADPRNAPYVVGLLAVIAAVLGIVVGTGFL